MSSTLALTILTVLAFTSQDVLKVKASFIPCKRCRPMECEQEPPQFCPFGETRDSCNRRMCAKGPDEQCGGPYNYLGDCGEGMVCQSDNRCHGCYLETMKCSKGYGNFK